MIWGVLLLMIVFCVFTVTHFLATTPDQPPLDLAAELCMILLSGLLLIAGLLVVRHLL